MLNLNLPEFDYSLKKEGNKLYILDIIRKKYIFLTPEEWVRQHYINYLVVEKKVPKNLIGLESGIRYNTLKKRTDILVYGKDMNPVLLVECKAPHVSLGNKVLDQISMYNSRIKSANIAITNGLVHYYWKIINREIKELNELAEYPFS